MLCWSVSPYVHHYFFRFASFFNLFHHYPCPFTRNLVPTRRFVRRSVRRKVANAKFCLPAYHHYCPCPPARDYFLAGNLALLVVDTRLYTLPCRSVGRSVTFLNSERFSHYCSCPTVRDWIAVYPALFLSILLF